MSLRPKKIKKRTKSSEPTIPLKSKWKPDRDTKSYKMEDGRRFVLYKHYSDYQELKRALNAFERKRHRTQFWKLDSGEYALFKQNYLSKDTMKHLIGEMSTPNVKRLSEGNTPLDFGRGEEFDEKDFRDLGGIPHWMQDMAEKEMSRRMKTIKTPKEIDDPITVIKNNFGHAHVFKGDVRDRIRDLGRNVTLDDGTESEVYLQVDYDVEALKDYMTPEQLDDFEGGFAIIMEDVGYFEG